MTQTTIHSYYATDHDRLDELFKQFQASDDLNKSREFYSAFKAGLERHIVWEEEILFPLFETATGSRNAGPTAVMRQEHQQIKRFLETIAVKLQDAEPVTGPDEVGLLDVLAAHNWKEENILYPAIDQMVSTAEREAVFARMGVAE